MNQKLNCPKQKGSSFFLYLLLGLASIYFQACKSSATMPSDTAITAEGTADDLLDPTTFWAEEETPPYQPSATRTMDIVHMDLDLRFDWKVQQVLGTARLKMTPFFSPQKTVVLDAKDFEFESVYLLQGEKKELLSYRYDEKQLTLYFPNEVNPKDTLTVEVSYTAFPERNSGEGSAAITDTKGLYFIDPLDTLPSKATMLWTQGETEHNSKWFPTLDRPNERFTHSISLTVPDTMVSISNGRLVRQEPKENGMRTDYWEMNLPHAPYLVAIAVGNFGKVESSYKNIPLAYYVEKGYEPGAAKVFERTPQMMAYFESLLKTPFPWPKYDQIVVRDYVSGAMENTTASIFMEELLLDEREALDSEWDYIVAHELFHQWFGDLVTAESWSNLTLNEAFANYSEYLWTAHQEGQDDAAMKLITEMEGYFSEAESKQVDLIRFNYADAEDMFDAHSYNKGGVVLHMLRRHLGDEAFFKGLTLYLNTHAFGSVEAHDLRLALEKVSGQDLNWFFNQWFFDKGHPELDIEVDYSQPENILVTLTQVQDTYEGPVFQLPIPLSWYQEGERFTRTFLMSEVTQQLALENQVPIEQLYIDEGQEFLAKKSQSFTSAQYLRQYKESQLGIARYEALDSLVSRSASEELKEILPLAMKDTFWSIRERALRVLQSDISWKDSLPELEEQVFALGNQDTKNEVKAAAIDVLTEWNPDAYQNAFQRWVRHPSYLVAGAALMGLAYGKDPAMPLDYMVSFEKETNYRMRVPLAEYYLMNKVKGKGAWFDSALKSMEGVGLYYFMGYYTSYFSEFPEEGKAEAVTFLLGLLRSHSKDYVRLGAFQSLLSFTEEPGVLESLEKASEVEKSEDLKNYFSYFLEMFDEEN